MGLFSNISNFFVRNRYQKQWFPYLQDAVWNGRLSTRLDKIRKSWGGIIVKSFFYDVAGHSKNFYNRKVSPLLFSKKNLSNSSLKKTAVVMAGVGLSVLGLVAVKRLFQPTSVSVLQQAVSNSTVLSGGIGIPPEFLSNAASTVKGLATGLQARLPSLASSSSAGLGNGAVVIGVLALVAFLVHRSRNSSRAVESTPRDEKPVQVKETSSNSEGNKDRPHKIEDIRKVREVNLRDIDKELRARGDATSFLNRAGYSFQEFSSLEDRELPSYFAIMGGLDQVARNERDKA